MTEKSRIKSSQRVARHFNEACGRMITAGFGIVLCLYLAKWLHARRPEIEIAFYAKILVVLLSFFLILWSSKYVSNKFPYIYRYFVLRSREYNSYVFQLLVFPLAGAIQAFWFWIVFSEYSHIIDEFFRDGNPRPLVGLLSGVIWGFLFLIFLHCRATAVQRGIKLQKKSQIDE